MGGWISFQGRRRRRTGLTLFLALALFCQTLLSAAAGVAMEIAATDMAAGMPGHCAMQGDPAKPGAPPAHHHQECPLCVSGACPMGGAVSLPPTTGPRLDLAGAAATAYRCSGFFADRPPSSLLYPSDIASQAPPLRA
jgi:hypothetical protein